MTHVVVSKSDLRYIICVLTAMLLTAGRKLKLFQASDPYKQWWTLDEVRFCSKCERPFLGSDIKVYEDERGQGSLPLPDVSL